MDIRNFFTPTPNNNFNKLNKPSSHTHNQERGESDACAVIAPSKIIKDPITFELPEFLFTSTVVTTTISSRKSKSSSPENVDDQDAVSTTYRLTSSKNGTPCNTDSRLSRVVPLDVVVGMVVEPAQTPPPSSNKSPLREEKQRGRKRQRTVNDVLYFPREDISEAKKKLSPKHSSKSSAEKMKAKTRGRKFKNAVEDGFYFSDDMEERLRMYSEARKRRMETQPGIKSHRSMHAFILPLLAPQVYT